jgi:mannose-1-phosphate guanylyltransferase / phosphomannomutase
MKKAVIMAGGFGTRLRPLTMTIPKPMVPLVNRPMMGHIVNLLKKHHITDMVSLLYFSPEDITGYFGSGKDFGISMSYMTAEADFGTAGSVKNAQQYLDEPFIIISGDVLTDFDLTKAIEEHRRKGAMASIVLTRVDQPLQYGIVMTDDEGRITRFLEKPSWGEVFSDTINTGIYLLQPEVLDLIPEKAEFDFSKDLFPKMLSMGLPLYGIIAEGYWKDVGNLNEYQLAHYDVLAGKVQVDIPGETCDSAICGTDLKLSPSAHLEGTVVLGDNVSIGDNAFLSNCVIGNNVSIGAGTRMIGTVVWDGCTIGNFSELSNDVICSNVRIGDHVAALDNVFIAEECVIEDGARLLTNIKLWPRKVVEREAVLARSLVQDERWARELFTDSRISGKANVGINPEFGAKLGAALGTSLGAGKLVVCSRDDDPVSRMIKRSISAGLMSAGVSVTDLQTTSVPQTRQEMHTGRYVAGVHVRRSPRDGGSTDIIMFGKDGRDIPLDSTKKIERFFYGEDIYRVSHDRVGRLHFPERSMGLYIDRFLSTLDIDVIKKRRFSLLVDHSHGLSTSVFPQILGELQCRVLAMNNYVDSTQSADPLGDSLDRSATIMRSLGFEVGVKIDAGAERISLVDERGIWYTGLRLLTIVTKLVLDVNKDMEPYKIAVPVQATMEIEKIAQGHNVEVVRIRNSHGAMMDATKDPDVRFVGGTRGGFIFPEFLFAADGMYSACRFLQMIAQTGHTLSELDIALPKRHQASISVPCPWEAKGTVMRRAMEFSEGRERQLIDGVKILDQELAILLVPDRENASFSVTAEADDAAIAVKERDRYADLVAAWRDGN